MKPQTTGIELLAELTADIAVSGIYHNPKMILCTDLATIPPTAALADVTVPTFTGYATSGALTWNTPHIDDAGNAVVLSQPVEFKRTDSGANEAATHAALVSNDGTTLLQVMKFTTPLNFADTSDVYSIAWPLIRSQPAESDVVVVS